NRTPPPGAWIRRGKVPRVAGQSRPGGLGGDRPGPATRAAPRGRAAPHGLPAPARRGGPRRPGLPAIRGTAPGATRTSARPPTATPAGETLSLSQTETCRCGKLVRQGLRTVA